MNVAAVRAAQERRRVSLFVNALLCRRHRPIVRIKNFKKSIQLGISPCRFTVARIPEVANRQFF